MKKMILGLILLTSTAWAADREAARQNTALLNTFVTASQSTTPNKALMYRSARDNVDDVTITSALSMTKAATTITITRGETLNLTRCSADFGTASVSGTTVIVNSDKAPIRVLCTTNDGAQRVFYTTYQQ